MHKLTIKQAVDFSCIILVHTLKLCSYAYNHFTYRKMDWHNKENCQKPFIVI